MPEAIICPDCQEIRCDWDCPNPRGTSNIEQPPNDAPFTWHVHDDGGWGRGAVCEVCVAERPEPAGAPYFNIRHLKRQNITGMSSRMEEREAIGDRWNDPTIDRVR